MNFISTIIVFTLTWWLSFFSLLPVGVKADQNPILGHDQGAPLNKHLPMKLILATVIAILSTTLIYFIADKGWISVWS